MARRQARRHKPPTWLLACSALVVGALVLLTVVNSRGGESRPGCRSTLIPAYVPATTIADLAEGSRRDRIVILNPASGPGTTRDADYARAVSRARAAGTRVLGYVPTTYGARDTATVETDIDRYEQWYEVDGIFLDEASHSADKLPYYDTLSKHIRASGDHRLVVLNPGVVPAKGYFEDADVVVTFEGAYAEYGPAVARMPAWARELPPRRIAHLVYGASRQQAMEIIKGDSLAGYVYVTPGTMPDPWRELSPYLAEEEALLEACT
jgi:hypothetical protein